MFLIGAIALSGGLIGAGLGLFFRVFLLVPVALVSLLLAISLNLAYEYDLQLRVVSTIAILIAPQIGYLIASGIHGFSKPRRILSAAASEPAVEVPVTEPVE